MPDSDSMDRLLTHGGQRLVDATMQKQIDAGHSYLGIHHWLAALLERHATMVEDIVAGFSAETVRADIAAKLDQGELGQPLDRATVIHLAAARARQRDRIQANERDLAAVILSTAGYAIQRFEGGVHYLAEANLSASQASEPLAKQVKTPTPNLDQFGRDLTLEARKGKLSAVVGRDEETGLVIETLCRRTKRNPVLVGPAGVGKTAVVEGLAIRVVQGNVPGLLKDARIVCLSPAVLIAGAHMSGELEKRMKAILEEAKGEGILLFIDEIHTIMGAGGMLGTTDLGSMLKPALARGDIACIAATTDEEYRRFIENDSALERRFQPIRIQELSPAQTLEVLKSVRDELSREKPIKVGADVLKWLVDFAGQFMRNRYFPDKGVDLLEQCFAYALANNKDSLEMQDARQVAQRMVGMPVVSSERLLSLSRELVDRCLLTENESQALINRLQVTMRGLDMRSARPNAVVCLSGDGTDNGAAFAEVVAEHLFDAPDRVITIDCSRFSQPEDINLLVGAPPGYVGYSDRLPIHRLLQIPWSVLLFERIDTAHPRIREVLAQAFLDGWLMDGRGKTIYLSDTIIVMTAEMNLATHRGLGFHPEAEQVTEDSLSAEITARLGDSLAEQVDLFSFGAAESAGVSIEWLKDHFLSELCERYMKQGLQIDWDASFMDWLSTQQAHQLSEHDWEAWVDRYLTPAIIPYLPPSDLFASVKVKVSVEDDEVKVLKA